MSASLTFNTMNLFHTAPHLISLCSNNNVFCISCQVLTTLRSAVNWENNKRTKSLNHATPSAALCRELLADVSVDFQTIATERIRVLPAPAGTELCSVWLMETCFYTCIACKIRILNISNIRHYLSLSPDYRDWPRLEKKAQSSSTEHALIVQIQ